MLNRILRQWMSGYSRPRRAGGGSEIRGQWEVVAPLGQLGADALRSMRQILEIDTRESLHTIGTLFEVAYRHVNHLAVDPKEIRSLADQAPEAIRLTLFHEREINPPGWLLYAVDCVRDQHPDLYVYEARRRTVEAYHQAFSKGGRITLPPAPQLAPVPNPPPPPGIDSAYIHLIDLGPAYMDDPIYQSLCDTSPEHLPDGAMLPLLQVLYSVEHPHPDSDKTTIDMLLARYGDRLYPAVVEFLSYPDRYVPHRATAYHPTVFKLISAWPRAFAEPLFRAAFESGWNKCTRFLPREGWAKDLAAAFSDSPYGRPQ